MSTILWQDITNGALDRCRLGVTPSGLRLAGTVLTAANGDPLEVRYLVTTDEKGRLEGWSWIWTTDRPAGSCLPMGWSLELGR